MTPPNEAAAARQLAQWMTGKWISRALHAAASLSIADMLQSGEASLEELAARTGTHAPSLYRLMRALTSIGVFRESAPRRFQSTVLGDLLKEGAMRAGCLMMHSEWHEAAWGRLLDSLRTGESAFTRAHGEPLFDWLGHQPEAADTFSEAMTAGKAYRDRGIAEQYDFSQVARVVDVGGGHGSLLVSLLQRHLHLEGVIFDLPQVAAGARALVEKAGLSGRCRVASGSFFDSVPSGAEVYLLAHVLHDWDDRACRRILENCRAAMTGGHCRLLVVESPVAEANEADRTKWIDLEMLVLTEGGRERTEQEYRQLLAEAGFELARVIATAGSRSVLEARPRPTS